MPGNKQLSGCRVLIVEDEYFVANDLEEALKACGANVVGPIADYSEAYHQAVHDQFDLALLDINLRNKETYPIADELIRQGVPFIFCTGYDRKLIPERFAGVRLCSKPFKMSELIDQIELLCRK
jgi:DNA-binding response OmpR family regulator